jgi:hypothetical protein
MKKIGRILFVCFFVFACLCDSYSQSSRAEVKGFNNVDSFNLMLKSAVIKDDKSYFDGKTSIVINNTSIRITPPKAFRKDDKQENLLIQDWTSSNILVQELPISYKKMLVGINKETFGKQGFEYISAYDVFTKSGNEGKLFVLSFKTGEWEYERLVLLSGDDKKTAWISANYPVIMRHLLYEILESSILNIEF